LKTSALVAVKLKEFQKMKAFLTRAKERAEQAAEAAKEQAAGIRRIDEHRKEFDQHLGDYLKEKDNRTRMGWLNTTQLILDRTGDRRYCLLFSFKETGGPNKWRYNVTKYNATTDFSVRSAANPSQDVGADPMVELAQRVSNYDLDEDGMLDEIIDWLG
jgi:hypothetical protein